MDLCLVCFGNFPSRESFECPAKLGEPGKFSVLVLVLLTSSVKQSTATYQPAANMNNSNTNTGNKKSKKTQQGREYPSLSIVGFQRIGP